MSTNRVGTFSILVGIIFPVGILPVAAQGQGTLFVEGDRVGVGIDTPAQELHVFSSDPQVLVESSSGTNAERVLFVLRNKGKVRFRVENTQANSTWTFDNDGTGRFNISKVGTGVAEMVLDGNGNLTILGSLIQDSSVFSKENISLVDSVNVLERVLALPIAAWNYKDDGESIRHLGPMAQDFYRLFGLGGTDEGISSLDTTGVALAAIQGLHELLEEKDAKIADLEEQILSLRRVVQGLQPQSTEE